MKKLDTLDLATLTGSPKKTTINQRIVLNSRPNDKPIIDNFRLEKLTASSPNEGQVLLRTLYLSLDPYMRGRLSSAPSYAAPVKIGQVIVGGTVSRVEISNHPAFHAGDLVVGQSGWQSHAVSDGTGLTKLDPEMPQPSLALGVLGMPGFIRSICEFRTCECVLACQDRHSRKDLWVLAVELYVVVGRPEEMAAHLFERPVLQ